MGRGCLRVDLFLADKALPVAGAVVLIKGENGRILYELISDQNGLTETVCMEVPDKDNSMTPFAEGPRFAICDIEVPFYKNYKKVIIHNVEVFDGVTSICPIQMHPYIIGDTEEENTDEIFIPLKHAVDEPTHDLQLGEERNRSDLRATQNEFASPEDDSGSSFRPLANEVIIPDYITVHLGAPNAVARNLRVPFKDYIKNVASSEIFPTWEESALYANIYCQISFALNRVYTIWYRSRGFEYDITNSTAFDQAFVEGRNIFQNISLIVDGIFNNFLRREGRREPFFAQYCNGTTVTCPGLSQWGSQDLALQGYTPTQILHYYFPNDVQIVESTNFTENVGTYPGTALREGASGEAVRLMQIYLNRISGNFYITPIGVPDGIFGSATKNTVTQFQEINFLIADGIIGKRTWYQITKIYVAVRMLAELESEGERIGIGTVPPTVVLNIGARGPYVVELQFLLNFISEFFPAVPFVVENGIYQDPTKRAVTEFQKEFNLVPDGIVGPMTWSKLYSVYWSIENTLDA